MFKSTFKQQFFGNNFYLKLLTMDLLYAFFLKQAFLETSVHILFFCAEIREATKKSQKKIMKIQLVLLQGLQSNETWS